MDKQCVISLIISAGLLSPSSSSLLPPQSSSSSPGIGEAGIGSLHPRASTEKEETGGEGGAATREAWQQVVNDEDEDEYI